MYLCMHCQAKTAVQDPPQPGEGQRQRLLAPAAQRVLQPQAQAGALRRPGPPRQQRPEQHRVDQLLHKACTHNVRQM